MLEFRLWQDRLRSMNGPMRWGPHVVTMLAFCAFPLAASAADRSFATKGTYAVQVEDVASSTTQVVRPTTAGTYPLVVASHGFSANGDNQLGWAKHFASWGFVVAVPSFESTFSPDHAANAKVIANLVSSLGGAGTKVGLEGHSAGGLATALAAVDVKPDAIVFFDPVDDADKGKTASASLTAPVLGIFAAPSSCNAQAAWKGFVTSSKGSVLAFDVKGSTHCDGENAPRGLCGIACGGAANETRQSAYAHYATAFLLAQLTADAKAKTALADADNDAELAGVLHTQSAPSGPDASAPTGDASTSSGGNGADPGSPSPGNASSSGSTSPAATASDDASAGGCSVQSEGSAGRGLLFALACAALGVVERRRRRARATRSHARG